MCVLATYFSPFFFYFFDFAGHLDEVFFLSSMCFVFSFFIYLIMYFLEGVGGGGILMDFLEWLDDVSQAVIVTFGNLVYLLT